MEEMEHFPANDDHSPSVLNNWKAWRFNDGTHDGADAWGVSVRFFSARTISGNISKGRTTLYAQTGPWAYAWVRAITLTFLNAYLKHDADAMAFLKKTPAEAGVPAHTLAINFRPALWIAINAGWIAS